MAEIKKKPYPPFAKEDFNPNGPGEFVHGLLNAIDLPKVVEMKTKAEKAAKRLYGSGKTGTGRGNAFLHGYMSYLLTMELGGDKAKKFMDAHEVRPFLGYSPRTREDTAIDLFNNRVGRELAKSRQKGDNPETIIRKAIGNGEFKIP